MSRWETTGFHTGAWVHSFKGYSAFCLGTGLCPNTHVLGGEDEFYHCTGFINSVASVDYWVQTELDKLDELQQVKLEFILSRNKLFKAFTDSKIDELAEIYKVETYHLYRLGTLELLNQLIIQDEFNGTTLVADFIIENDIKQISSIEPYISRKLQYIVTQRKNTLRYAAGVKANEELISLRDSFGSDVSFTDHIIRDLTNE